MPSGNRPILCSARSSETTWPPGPRSTLPPTASCDVIDQSGSPAHQPGFEQELFALEFADRDPLTYSKVIASDRNAARLRTEVTDPEAVERYRRLLAPAGASDEMRVILEDGTGVWGALTLYRTQGWEPFDESSEQVMESLSSHLAASFRHAFLVASVGVGRRPPGTLTLGGMRSRPSVGCHHYQGVSLGEG